jgi:hypothetical protein
VVGQVLMFVLELSLALGLGGIGGSGSCPEQPLTTRMTGTIMNAQVPRSPIPRP